MTFGRPAIISNAGWDVPTPLEIDDEYLQKVGEGTQPAGTTTRMGLFVYSSHLYEVFNDALSTSHCYTGNGDLSKSGTSELRSHLMLDHVLALNRRLDRFVESLPKYLQPNISSDSPLQKNDNYITMQQQIMYCRFSGTLTPFRKHPSSIPLGSCTTVSSYCAQYFLQQLKRGVKLRPDHQIQLQNRHLIRKSSEKRVIYVLRQRIAWLGVSFPTLKQPTKFQAGMRYTVCFLIKIEVELRRWLTLSSNILCCYYLISCSKMSDG